MSNLYIKHRPDNFDDVIGNKETVESLRAMTSDIESCPHTFMLHGPTGCGKTTIGRILAKELGCDPIDLKEINSADFRGIETVRELIRTSKYHSIGGKIRVWLIDEAHKMTNDAQNALLKLLEDTPEGAYFIICTTEPEKIIKTIRGRCIDFQVNLLNEKEMGKLLKTVAKKETDERLQKEVYELLIDSAQGHPRNALQALQKVLMVSPENRLEAAKSAIVNENQSIELCRALLADRPAWKKVRGILEGLQDQDAESIRRHVLGYAKSMLMKGENDRAALVIEEFWEPLYNVGMPGLVFMCYSVIKS